MTIKSSGSNESFVFFPENKKWEAEIDYSYQSLLGDESYLLTDCFFRSPIMFCSPTVKNQSMFCEADVNEQWFRHLLYFFLTVVYAGNDE